MTGTQVDGGSQEMDRDRLRTLIHGSLSAEFVSIWKGNPATYPMTPFYDDDTQRIVVSSPLAYAGKVENVRQNSRVAILLHDEDGEYAVTGDACIRDDDPKTSEGYVRTLVLNEPETKKRAVYKEKLEFLDSWIGRTFMGWYGLRVVVEIDPVSMVRVADTSSIKQLPGWDSIEMDETEANRYERVVLSVIGDDGYPVIRPVTALRVRNGEAIVEPEPTTPLEEGQPACLLAHWHDDKTERLGQRIIRGRFRTDSNPLRFVPGSSFELTVNGILDMLRFIIDGKRRTKAYFRD